MQRVHGSEKNDAIVMYTFFRYLVALKDLIAETRPNISDMEFFGAFTSCYVYFFSVTSSIEDLIAETRPNISGMEFFGTFTSMYV